MFFVKYRHTNSASGLTAKDSSFKCVDDVSNAQLICRHRGRQTLVEEEVRRVGRLLYRCTLGPAVYAQISACGAAVEFNGHHSLSCMRSADGQSCDTSVNGIICAPFTQPAHTHFASPRVLWLSPAYVWMAARRCHGVGEKPCMGFYLSRYSGNVAHLTL